MEIHLSGTVLRRVALGAILLLALVLRLSGSTWGLPSKSFPHPPLHPDEVWALQNLAQIDVPAGDINPESGQREGAFHYYLWLAGIGTAKAFGFGDELPWHAQLSLGAQRRFIRIARVLNIGVEIGTSVLLYLAARQVLGGSAWALLAPLIWAVLPFEIIYARYARPHVLANFFLAAVTWLSFRLYERNRLRDYLTIAAVVGIGAASRWLTASALLVPGIISIMLARWGDGERLESLGRLARLWGLGLLPATLMCMVLANPALVLDSAAVAGPLLEQVSYADTSQFASITGLFDPDRLFLAFTYLFPYGLALFLWPLVYASMAYAVFSMPGWRRYTVPMLAFTVLHLLVMGKGYLTQPVFVRSLMMTFPMLALLTTLAAAHAWERLTGRPYLRAVLGGFVAVCVASAIPFDVDYSVAMAKGDPREDATTFLRAEAAKGQPTVGMPPNIYGAFVANAALHGVNVTAIPLPAAVKDWQLPAGAFVLIGDQGSPEDWLLATDRLPPYRGNLLSRALVEELESRPDFHAVCVFDRTPVLLGWLERWLGQTPHDYRYPFVVLKLFGKVSQDTPPRPAGPQPRYPDCPPLQVGA